MKLRPEDIPPCFYRVSAKALILDESRKKFLIVQEEDGKWELPGGGIDHGENPQEALKRELKEEMGLKTLFIAPRPSYFLTFKNVTGYWMSNALYETKVENLSFTPSNECIAIRFVSPDNLPEIIDTSPNVMELGRMFDPKDF